jgi:photosystem II stability/assembly factor-like uncharacterized protein
VYHSEDEGLTWQPFFGPAVGVPDSIDQDVRTFPRRIGCMAFQNDGFAIGSVFLDDSLPAGLYLWDARDQGPGLAPCVFWGERSYNCHSVLFHPRDGRTIFAAIEPDGSLNGIWRSRDFGKHWDHLTKGLPPGDQFRRISLAFAPSDPDVIYALAADRANYVLGLFRSTNGGNSWREILGGRYPSERQMSYNNAIVVHPRKPECVIWGGMHLYRTGDAGRNWRRITSATRGMKDYVHADHHALLWPEDDVIVSGNDGGVAVTRDGGRNWSERSRGMVTAMFYDLDVAPSNGKVFGGGTQDNGTLIAGVPGSKDGDFVPAIPGDGAWVVFDPADAGNVFACAAGFQVYHHPSGKPWDYANWKLVKPRQISAEESSQRAFTVLAIEPSTDSGVKTVWAGSDRLWRTDNNGQSWKPVSGSFDGTPISAIAIARARPRLMFVGTTGGGIFRSRDGGVTWSQTLSAVDIPARAITSIAVHPEFPSTVVVTVASSGVKSSGVDLTTGADRPYRHVFRSPDTGDTWEDIDGGELPNVVFYAAAYQSHPPHQLFVAGDAGVWAGIEGGWLNISGNLPSVVVSDLVYHHHDGTLTAATYGRGIWRIRPGIVARLVGPPSPAPEEVPMAAGLRVDPAVAAPVPLTPADGAVIDLFPRKTLVTVQPVPGAMGYQVEFAAEGAPSLGASSTTPEIEFEAAGMGSGKWRVWAILPDGLRTVPSAWHAIRYLQ